MIKQDYVKNRTTKQLIEEIKVLINTTKTIDLILMEKINAELKLRGVIYE